MIARSIGAAAASSSPSRRCANPRFAHAAGSFGNRRRHRRELALRVVEQSDLERRQAAIEGARHLFVDFGAGGWKGVARAQDEYRSRDGNRDDGDQSDDAVRLKPDVYSYPAEAEHGGPPEGGRCGFGRLTRHRDAAAVRAPRSAAPRRAPDAAATRRSRRRTTAGSSRCPGLRSGNHASAFFRMSI